MRDALAEARDGDADVGGVAPAAGAHREAGPDPLGVGFRSLQGSPDALRIPLVEERAGEDAAAEAEVVLARLLREGRRFV